MKERRNIRSWEFQPFLPLFEAETDEILGYVADNISREKFTTKS